MKGTDPKGRSRRKRAAARVAGETDPAALPLFCDYSCPRAAFPPESAVGACRREQAVWCTALGRFNNKNNRCLVRR